MITIKLESEDLYDEVNGFTKTPEKTLRFEHSLYSISKWETIHLKPFMDNGVSEKTTDEILSYFVCMCLDDCRVEDLTPTCVNHLHHYLNLKQTATTFSNEDAGYDGTIKTSEVLYGYMITNNVPFECQYWPLERLLTLIKVVNTFNSEQKTMPKSEVISENQRINEMRRKKYNSKG